MVVRFAVSFTVYNNNNSNNNNQGKYASVGIAAFSFAGNICETASEKLLQLMLRTFSEVDFSQCTYPFLYLTSFMGATRNVNCPQKSVLTT